VMARTSFRTFSTIIIVKSPASIVGACFFCRRAGRAFNTALNSDLAPHSLASGYVPLVLNGLEHDKGALESGSPIGNPARVPANLT